MIPYPSHGLILAPSQWPKLARVTLIRQAICPLTSTLLDSNGGLTGMPGATASSESPQDDSKPCTGG